MVTPPFVVVTVALPHEVQVRLTDPLVSVAVTVVALTFEAVIPPFVSVRVRLDELMLEICRSPFNVTICTVLNWVEDVSNETLLSSLNIEAC